MTEYGSPNTIKTTTDKNEINKKESKTIENEDESKYGQYATSEFWETHYENLREEEGVDWYIKYEDLSGVLEKYIKEEDRVLHLGAGSSSNIH